MLNFHFFAIISIYILCKTNAVEKNKYLGCYENNEKTKLLHLHKQIIDSGLTSAVCVDICNSKKFSYAGLEKNICHCGNAFPSEIAKRPEVDCSHPCSGNPSLSCGGESKLAIYETGTPDENRIPNRVYLGCYLDNVPEFRVLKGSSQEFSDNSPDKCHKLCLKQGFKYFGLTYIKECFCGDTVLPKVMALDENKCNTPCNGDSNEICGGGWIMSIFATGITDIPELGRYIGCYNNSNEKQVKSELTLDLSKSNTNRRCLNICDQKGYKYSGVQKGTNCYCMNELLPASFRSDDYNCNIDKCSGELTEKCGNKENMKIHKTRNADNIPSKEITYLGCYKDQLNFRTMDDDKEVFENNLTPSLCVEFCKNRGYAFSGVEFGKECFCSHKFPSIFAYAGEDDCNTPCSGNGNELCGGHLRIGAYDNGLPHAQAMVHDWYEGCFRDDDKDNRVLKGSWQELINNSPEVCHKHCFRTGYSFYGLTWIKECFCGDETPSEELLLNDSECQKECGGDSTKKCGGAWRLSVYRTGLADIEINNNYLGCFKNDGTLLDEWKTEMSSSLNPKRCQNICDVLGFLYAGLERGMECRCGNKGPGKIPVEEDSKCGTKCPRNSAESCGDHGYVKIYQTLVTDSNVQVTSPEKSISKRTCETSLTFVNGRRTCVGKQIFSENFVDLNSSKWSYTVKMASDPDYEFVTYSSSPNVVYVKDGRLNIQPKLQPDNFIRSSLTLNDCTGIPSTDECSRKAIAFNILPPVLSAQVSTKTSFSFRYGRINVRARLPIGDWIVPEIWLTPKENSYGEQYQSGQIRIAWTRGNKNLNCDNVQLGNTQIAVGVYFGPPDGVKNKIFYKSVPNNWNYKFHNFTTIWSPDNIKFQIDGEDVATVLNPNFQNVRQAVELPQNAEYIYKNGSNLAPFDKEFFVTLGVSVGGVSDFPDSCTSNGQKKPWLNTAPKAMLNFWEKREQWNASWTERSALQIEHVKVHAL